jgi:hypothetical protein
LGRISIWHASLELSLNEEILRDMSGTLKQLKIDIKAERQEEKYLREVEQNCCPTELYENGFASRGEHSGGGHQSYSLPTHIPYLGESREIVVRLLWSGISINV